MFLLCFDSYNVQHNAKFAAARTFHEQTFLHKHCFYTSPAFKQALLLHKSVFTQDLLLHKPCFYTSTVFTQALLLHKACFYTIRFYTRPPFTQTLSLRKLCLYTSIAFIQALLLHNDILLTKAFCNLQTGNRLEGRRNAEGCKYVLYTIYYIYIYYNMCYILVYIYNVCMINSPELGQSIKRPMRIPFALVAGNPVKRM